jgi:hypothetical protein
MSQITANLEKLTKLEIIALYPEKLLETLSMIPLHLRPKLSLNIDSKSFFNNNKGGINVPPKKLIFQYIFDPILRDFKRVYFNQIPLDD